MPYKKMMLCEINSFYSFECIPSILCEYVTDIFNMYMKLFRLVFSTYSCFNLAIFYHYSAYLVSIVFHFSLEDMPIVLIVTVPCHCLSLTLSFSI